MNKSLIFHFSFFVFSISLFSCGPAAEDRRAMHERARAFQDSIAISVKATMAEAGETVTFTTVEIDKGANNMAK